MTNLLQNILQQQRGYSAVSAAAAGSRLTGNGASTTSTSPLPPSPADSGVSDVDSHYSSNDEAQQQAQLSQAYANLFYGGQGHRVAAAAAVAASQQTPNNNNNAQNGVQSCKFALIVLWQRFKLWNSEAFAQMSLLVLLDFGVFFVFDIFCAHTVSLPLSVRRGLTLSFERM